ncbi:MAG: 23S rRNA (adenine(2503)-C(2))-methyltransferase RlmN [Deltaproteobacteria bacterium]|nr:23S rRNA (adenine(2503)-C(2))-methyltransferase RlmN [Deltaproteobacteria bacterium]
MSDAVPLAAASPHAGEIAGLTLRGFAARLGTSPAAARAAYRQAMRTPGALTLPPLARREEQDGVRKFCLAVPGVGDGPGLETESVIIPMHSYRGSRWHTLCVSSQVGCRMGCTFCETGRMGLVRNLSVAEIVGQFLVARDLMLQTAPAAARPYRYFSSGIENIVFMGMGEPLDNFEAVSEAIRVLSEPNGLNFPHAQITVSTVGRIDGLRRLAALGWPNLRIAISLNAPDDALRRALMPVNAAMPLAALREALLAYPLARKGYFLIEYVLMRGINDAPAQARAVAAWCRGLRCVVNLIPYNPQRQPRYAAPDEAAIVRFAAELRAAGVFVKRRLTKGRDLLGACGQLGNPAVAVRRGASTLATDHSAAATDYTDN